MPVSVFKWMKGKSIACLSLNWNQITWTDHDICMHYKISIWPWSIDLKLSTTELIWGLWDGLVLCYLSKGTSRSVFMEVSIQMFTLSVYHWCFPNYEMWAKHLWKQCKNKEESSVKLDAVFSLSSSDDAIMKHLKHPPDSAVWVWTTNISNSCHIQHTASRYLSRYTLNVNVWQTSLASLDFIPQFLSGSRCLRDSRVCTFDMLL